MKYKVDVNVNYNGKTPLMIACEKKDRRSIVCSLLQTKADPNIGDNNKSPLHYAVCNRDYQLVSYLLEYKADPNMGEGETFLHKLTYDKDISMFDKFSFTGSDNLNCVKQLLVAKSDLTRRNDKGQTPLMSATFWGNYYCLKLLLKYGFKTMTSSDRYYCLIHCSKTDNVDCLKLLLNAKCSANILGPDDEVSPLHMAVSSGSGRCVQILISYKANVNRCDKEGKKPLHYAVDNNNTDLIKALLANRANPRVTNSKKEVNIIDYALANGTSTVVALLAKYGRKRKR